MKSASLFLTIFCVFVNIISKGQLVEKKETYDSKMFIPDSILMGYALQPKKLTASAVAIANIKNLNALPFRNLSNLLQGRLAGVNVINSGAPGSASRVRIRGISSLNGNEPLYIVDGVPMYDIQSLNPIDIESLTVLKDAAAASLYGSRSSGGVVVVTTKKGNPGLHITYSIYAGLQGTGKAPANLLNTQEYADLQWLVYKNDGTTETHPIYGPSSNPTPTLPSWAANTNWYNEVTKPAPITNHNLSLTGGNTNSNILVSLDYFNQEGVILNTNNKWFTARFNSNFKIKRHITIGENLQITHRSGLTFLNLSPDNAIGSVYRSQSIIPAIMNQSVAGISHSFIPGEWGGTGLAPRLGNARNAVADLTRNADDLNSDVRVFGNLYIAANIIKGLDFKSSFGGSYQNGYFSDYTFATYENVVNNPFSSLREGASYQGDWVWSNTLHYQRNFEQHYIDALVGIESLQLGTGRGVSGGRAGYFSDAVSFRTLSNGATITEANSYFNDGQKMYSSFLKIDYRYKNRYLLGASFRRDGDSSVFGNNVFGNYHALSAGWRISEESFLAESNFISDLKIRGSYGLMGNVIFANQTSANSNQSFTQTNLGVDVGLLKNKIEILLDVYKKRGSIQNTGLDVELKYADQITNDFSFGASLVITSYKNEIIDLGEGIDFVSSGNSTLGNLTRNQLGHSLSQFYGYQVQGLFQSTTEVSSAPAQPGAEPGFFRYRDVDKNGIIDVNDRSFIGDPNPTFTFGLNLSATYKSFDFTIFLNGSRGNDIFNYLKWYTDFWPSFQGQKSTNLLNNSWTGTRINAAVPKASVKSNFSTNTVVSDYYIEDGSFTRLRNIQVGYTFPGTLINKSGIKNLRVYLQGVNLITLTKYSGLDPELDGRDFAFGIDYGNHPNTPQYLIGATIEF
ncbi:MAG: TonB-dependent receptor plug domain-containing protein [Cyclobacteriaceae bacterium]